MKNIISLKAEIIGKEYEFSSLIGMDCITTYCIEKGIGIEDFFKMFEKSSSDLITVLTLIKELIYQGHLSYAEFEECEVLSLKKISVIIDNNDIVKVMEQFKDVLEYIMPKAVDVPKQSGTATKKK